MPGCRRSIGCWPSASASRRRRRRCHVRWRGSSATSRTPSSAPTWRPLPPWSVRPTATGRLSLVNRSLLESRILIASGDFDGRHRARHPPPPARPSPARTRRARPHPRLLAPVAGRPFQRGIEAARRAHRDDVAPQFGGVFRDHRLAASQEARLAWLIHYGTIDPVPLAAMREVIAEAPKSERPALEATLPSQPPAEPRGRHHPRIAARRRKRRRLRRGPREPDLEPVVRIDALRRTRRSAG